MLQIVKKSLAGNTIGKKSCVAQSMLCSKGSVSGLQCSLDSMTHGSYHLHPSVLKHSVGLYAHTEGKSSIHKRRKLAKRCAAPVAEGQEAGPTGRPEAPPAAPQQSSKSGQKGLRLERIERLGDEAWAGVAAIDRGDDSVGLLGKKALLIGGDTLALLAFAAVGRRNHGESLDVGSILSVAWPFLAGWYGSASLLGGYSAPATGSKARPAALVAMKTWALALPVAIGLRSVSRGYLPDKAFIVVSLAVTAFMLIGWRTGLAALTKSGDASQESAAQRRNKKGNPLEFLQLLTSLTKRW